jgi:DNA-binding response OmpR family regulator
VGLGVDPINVLVVDDDPSIVEMIRFGFEAEGMRVCSAGDGAEALEVLAREAVDVIVLDIMMPKVDGWMCLMEIRGNPLTADIPIIMLTAKTQDLAKILAFRQGVQQYVTKPFNILELSARVKSVAKARLGAGASLHAADGEFR